MDTKQLLEVLEDNNIALDPDDLGDAESAWIEAMIKSWDDFQDTWLDYAEAISDEDLKKMHKYLADSDHDLEYVGASLWGSGISRTTSHVFSEAFHMYLSRAALILVNNHRAQVEKLVEDMSDTWMGDCIGLKSDYEEGAREDYEYENYRDRQLEERE